MATGPVGAEVAIDESLQENVDKVKASVKELYDQQLKAMHIDIDKRKAKCWDFYDQLKPSHTRPDFKINFRTGRNNPENLQKELWVALVTETKRKESKSAKQVIDKFVKWINAEDGVIMDCKDSAIDLMKKVKVPEYIQNTLKKLSSDRKIKWDTDDESSTADIQDSSNPEFKINFRTGRAMNRKTLTAKLIEALDVTTDNAKKKIRTFVSRINTRMDGQSLAMEILELVDARTPKYMKCRLLELSISGQIRWETDDVDKVSDSVGDSTDSPGTVTYGHSRLLEAEKSWRRLSGVSKEVPTTRALLPMMYWLKYVKNRPTWAELNPYKRSSKSKNNDPPQWALGYIKRNEIEGKVQQFQPNKKPYKHKNAVYLLLCRSVCKFAPKEATVRAYAGRAKNGVENRWLQHAGAATHFIEIYRALKTFSAEPLLGSSLVDILVGRLYAEGGRKYITENDTEEHDNIALFVYCAYGPNKTDKDKMTEGSEPQEEEIDSEEEEGEPKEEEGEPKEEESKPKEEEGKPKEEEGKPKEEEGKPKEEEDKPKGEEDKPKGEEGKPKEEGRESVEEDSKGDGEVHLSPEERMKKTEKHLIKKLNLKDMTCGMNGRL